MDVCQTMGERMGNRQAPITVAFLEQETSLGGVEVTTLEVVRRLDRNRFHPVVICPAEGELVDYCRQFGIIVYILPRPSFRSVTTRIIGRYITNPAAVVAMGFGFLMMANRTAHFLRTHPVDLVCTKGLLSHFYGGMAAARVGVPCIWHMQEHVETRRAGGIYPGVLNWAARRWANHVVADAQTIGCQFAKDLWDAGRVHVVYNGVDTERLQPGLDRCGIRRELGIPMNAPVIGQVGRIIPLKGQHVLIKAVVHLFRQFPNLHILFVGAPLFDNGDYEVSLRVLATQLDLAEHVHFLGFRHDINQVLAAIDVLVHPSTEPDSPLVILEGLAAGKAIIATAVDGTRELVVDGTEAILVPPGDSAGLAQALARVLTDTVLRTRLGTAARRAALERYSLDISVRRLEQIFERTFQSTRLAQERLSD